MQTETYSLPHLEHGLDDWLWSVSASQPKCNMWHEHAFQKYLQSQSFIKAWFSSFANILWTFPCFKWRIFVSLSNRKAALSFFLSLLNVKRISMSELDFSKFSYVFIHGFSAYEQEFNKINIFAESSNTFSDTEVKFWSCLISKFQQF